MNDLKHLHDLARGVTDVSLGVHAVRSLCTVLDAVESDALIASAIKRLTAIRAAQGLLSEERRS